jgi:hypothetical protein
MQGGSQIQPGCGGEEKHFCLCQEQKPSPQSIHYIKRTNHLLSTGVKIVVSVTDYASPAIQPLFIHLASYELTPTVKALLSGTHRELWLSEHPIYL